MKDDITEEEARAAVLGICKELKDRAVDVAKDIQVMSEVGLGCNLIHTFHGKGDAEGIRTQIIILSGPIPADLMKLSSDFIHGLLQDFETSAKREGRWIKPDTGEPNEK